MEKGVGYEAIRLSILSDYYDKTKAEAHTLAVNYWGTEFAELEWDFDVFSKLI